MSNYSRSWTACAVIISSFIHSKAVVTRVKSLENDRQGRSRREYSVPETAVWPKMFHVNRARRHSPRLLLYLARLSQFRPRPHLSRVHSTPVLSPQFLGSRFSMPFGVCVYVQHCTHRMPAARRSLACARRVCARAHWQHRTRIESVSRF